LNKYDLFKEKVKSVDLSVCFNNYTGGLNEDNAKEFIKIRFLERTNNKVYVHFTTAIDTENIGFILKAVRETLLKDALSKLGIYQQL